MAVVPPVNNLIGYQQISPTSATALTVPTGARFALFQAESQNIRFRDDGTDPDGNTGMIIVKDLAPWRYDGSLALVKVYEDASGGKLNVLYYS